MPLNQYKVEITGFIISENLHSSGETNKCNDGKGYSNDDIDDGDDESRKDEKLVALPHAQDDQAIDSNNTDTPDESPDTVTN